MLLLPLSPRPLIAQPQHRFWNRAASTISVGAWKSWSFHFPNSYLPDTLTVENRMTFVSLLPSKFLPVPPIHRINQETRKENLEVSFSGFPQNYPPSQEREFGRLESKLYMNCLYWPIAFDLSPPNVKEQGGS